MPHCNTPPNVHHNIFLTNRSIHYWERSWLFSVLPSFFSSLSPLPQQRKLTSSQVKPIPFFSPFWCRISQSGRKHNSLPRTRHTRAETDIWRGVGWS